MARADHLVIQYMGFTHHAIDLGDGTCMEYGGKGTSFLSVRRVWLADLWSRGQVTVRHYPPGVALPDDEVVRRAWSSLDERLYDLFKNNCEHLAHWCKTGQHMSPQAETLKGALTVGAIFGGLALLTRAQERTTHGRSRARAWHY